MVDYGFANFLASPQMGGGSIVCRVENGRVAEVSPEPSAGNVWNAASADPGNNDVKLSFVKTDGKWKAYFSDWSIIHMDDEVFFLFGSGGAVYLTRASDSAEWGGM